MNSPLTAFNFLLGVALSLTACGPGDSTLNTLPTSAADTQDQPDTASSDTTTTLILYSGRGRSLVNGLMDQFETDTGITVQTRFSPSSLLARHVLSESDDSPADVFFSQNTDALALLAANDKLAPLSDDLLARVDPALRSPGGLWIGITGRARVLAYSSERVQPRDLPRSIFDLTSPEWKGRLGWTPHHPSFATFITAMRATHGEAETEKWLLGIRTNEPREYPRNTPIIQAIKAGEIDAGLVNHSYLLRFHAEEGDDYPVANHFFPDGDPGSFINVAGAAVLRSSDNKPAAEKLIAFLLGQHAQEFFRDQTFEYPLANGISPHAHLPPLDSLDKPNLNLDKLHDLEGTTALLRKTALLP